MQTFERELSAEQVVINPHVIEMADVLKGRGGSLEDAVRELREYSEQLWEDYRTGPEELQGSEDVEALEAAMGKDREWSSQLYWLAHFIEQEGDIDAGLSKFITVERESQQLSEQPIVWAKPAEDERVDMRDARIPYVAAVYGALEGKPGLFFGNRKAINRTIKGAEAKGLDGRQYIESLDDVYLEADVSKIADMLHRRKNIAEGLLALSLLFGGDRAIDAITAESEQPAIASAEIMTVEDTVNTTVTTLPKPETTVTTAIPTTTIATTTTLPPQTTTTHAPTTTVAPTTTAVRQAPPTTAAPTPAFSQRHFGRPGSEYADAPLSVIAQRLRERTGDTYDSQTIADYNGIEDPNNVPKGQQLVYKDCPENGALIVSGMDTGTFALDHGLSEEELHKLNGGRFQAVAGWCGRIAL